MGSLHFIFLIFYRWSIGTSWFCKENKSKYHCNFTTTLCPWYYI